MTRAIFSDSSVQRARNRIVREIVQLKQREIILFLSLSLPLYIYMYMYNLQ